MPATSPARVFLSYRPPACQRAPCRAGRERPPCDRAPGLWKRAPTCRRSRHAAQQDDLGIDFPPPPICTQFPHYFGRFLAAAFRLALYFLPYGICWCRKRRRLRSVRSTAPGGAGSCTCSTNHYARDDPIFSCRKSLLLSTRGLAATVPHVFAVRAEKLIANCPGLVTAVT
jgi:hypothetical protein